jgi:hypothetical protein
LNNDFAGGCGIRIIGKFVLINFLNIARDNAVIVCLVSILIYAPAAIMPSWFKATFNSFVAHAALLALTT